MIIETFVLLISFLLTPPSSTSTHTKATSPCFKSIISFGDSLADTGNYVILQGPTNPAAAAFPPYGRTFFNHPAGRFSDGRLPIDFIAESLGLPLVQPYLSGRHENDLFEKGVNFAFAGAVALDVQYFDERGYALLYTNITLGVEMNWFKDFLATIPDSRKYLQSSLIVLGEIGRNDLFSALTQGKSAKVAKSVIIDVISKIKFTIEELINLGAQTMLIPGMVPNGCVPYNLNKFGTSNIEDYDPKTGCIITLNELSEYFNGLLKSELNGLRKNYPHVNIIYGDYYNSMMRFYLSPVEFGFTKGALKACCEPVWLFDSPTCGQAVTCCDEPYSFVSWDGVHHTEAANRLIAQAMLEDSLLKICTSIASQSESHEYR